METEAPAFYEWRPCKLITPDVLYLGTRRNPEAEFKDKVSEEAAQEVVAWSRGQAQRASRAGWLRSTFVAV